MAKKELKSKIWLENYTAVYSALSKHEIEQLIVDAKDIPVEDAFGVTTVIRPSLVSSIDPFKDGQQ